MSQNKNNKIQKPMSDNNNASPDTSKKPSKRLVIVTGDKGGVGKSTFARGLLQLYINKDIDCIAYEADQRNPQLERHFGNKYGPLVHYVDIFRKGGADELLVNIEKEKDKLTFMSDLPAQSGGFFEEFIKEVSFFEMLKTIGYRVTMVSVISRVLDSVNVLEKLHECCKDQVDYVVVKNLFHGEEEKFERYNDSPFRQNNKDKLKEITMPDLFYKPYDFIDVHGLTFNDVQTHSETNIVIKARVRAWLNQFEEQVQPISDLFHLNNKPSPGIYKCMAKETENRKRKEKEEQEKLKKEEQEKLKKEQSEQAKKETPDSQLEPQST
jgi:hypothetical protein